jgi:hypothetical protein
MIPPTSKATTICAPGIALLFDLGKMCWPMSRQTIFPIQFQFDWFDRKRTNWPPMAAGVAGRRVLIYVSM